MKSVQQPSTRLKLRFAGPGSTSYGKMKVNKFIVVLNIGSSRSCIFLVFALYFQKQNQTCIGRAYFSLLANCHWVIAIGSLHSDFALGMLGKDSLAAGKWSRSVKEASQRSKGKRQRM